MKKSTRIRRNKKALANIELAQGLTCVRARAIAGSTLLGHLTSQDALTKKSNLKAYEQIQELLKYERVARMVW